MYEYIEGDLSSMMTQAKSAQVQNVFRADFSTSKVTQFKKFVLLRAKLKLKKQDPRVDVS